MAVPYTTPTPPVIPGVTQVTIGKNLLPESLVTRVEQIAQSAPNGTQVSVQRRYAPTEQGIIVGDYVSIGTGEDRLRLSRIDSNGDGVFDEYKVKVGNTTSVIQDAALRERLDAAITNAKLVNVGDIVECTPAEAGQLANIAYRAVSDVDLSQTPAI